MNKKIFSIAGAVASKILGGKSEDGYNDIYGGTDDIVEDNDYETFWKDYGDEIQDHMEDFFDQVGHDILDDEPEEAEWELSSYLTELRHSVFGVNYDYGDNPDELYSYDEDEYDPDADYSEDEEELSEEESYELWRGRQDMLDDLEDEALDRDCDMAEYFINKYFKK